MRVPDEVSGSPVQGGFILLGSKAIVSPTVELLTDGLTDISIPRHISIPKTKHSDVCE